MICPRCGYEETQRNRSYCSLCRTPFTAASPSAKFPTTQPPPAQRLPEAPVDPVAPTLAFASQGESSGGMEERLPDGDYDPGPTLVTGIPEEFLRELVAEAEPDVTVRVPSPARANVPASRPAERSPASEQEAPLRTVRMAPPSREDWPGLLTGAGSETPASPSAATQGSELAKPEGARSRPALPKPSRKLPRPGLKSGFVFARRVELPSLWRRLFAGVVDLLLVLVTAGALTLLLGPAPRKVWPAGLQGFEWMAFLFEHRSPQLLFFVIGFLVTLFVYQLLFHALLKRTPGKGLFGLRVVDMQGRGLSLLGSVARSFAFLLFSGALLTGLSWILFDRQYRGLHDRASGSLVIRS